MPTSTKKKRCCTCKKSRALNEFYRLRSGLDGRYPNCIECYKKQREPRRDKILKGRREWERRLRQEVLKHYGGRCRCCGEKTFEFLAIDHVQGKGNEHRKKIKTPLPYWLKKNGYPKGFRVLCHNCNMAYGRYGYCPHTNASV